MVDGFSCILGFPKFSGGGPPDPLIKEYRGGSRIFGSGFKLAEGGSICAVCLIFPEIPHENEII